MRNLKFIVGFTLTGFVISLFCGFFSHSKFLHVFLQALLFAVIFALLAIIISVVFEKYLNEGNGGGDSNLGEKNAGGQSNPQKGTKVDFVIQDEELPVSESENQFFVGENHQLLNDSDIKNSFQNDDGNQNQENAGFVPLQNESAENITGTEAKTSGDMKEAFTGLHSLSSSDNVLGGKAGKKGSSEKNADGANSFGSNVKANNDVDVLPDMQEVTFEKKTEDAPDVEVPFSSSEIGSDSSLPSKRTSNGVDAKDASLMAKAISSILSGES